MYFYHLKSCQVISVAYHQSYRNKFLLSRYDDDDDDNDDDDDDGLFFEKWLCDESVSSFISSLEYQQWFPSL